MMISIVNKQKVYSLICLIVLQVYASKTGTQDILNENRSQSGSHDHELGSSMTQITVTGPDETGAKVISQQDIAGTPTNVSVLNKFSLTLKCYTKL